MTLVITSCTNRKTRAANAGYCAANLRRGTIGAVAADWAARLEEARDRLPAEALYQGRAFREAQAAAVKLDARLAILSAGFGLLPAEVEVPAYAMTVVPGSPDNVLERIVPQASPAEWWGALRTVGLGTSLEDLAGEDLVLIAAGRLYLDMLAADAEALPHSVQRRLRVFTATPAHELPAVFRPMLMPYDDRLDGPDSPRPGAMSDFAQRALYDFAAYILSHGAGLDTGEHSDRVQARLASWRRPVRTRGASRTDPELRAMIAKHWQAVGGRSTAMLRLLRRDLGVACEQGRFRRLFQAVGQERAA